MVTPRTVSREACGEVKSRDGGESEMMDEMKVVEVMVKG